MLDLIFLMCLGTAVALRCPSGSLHLSFSHFCVCERANFVCVDSAAGHLHSDGEATGCGEKQLPSGTVLSGYDASCKTCSCVDRSAQCELVLADSVISPEKCRSSVLWPHCSNRLWGYVLRTAPKKIAPRCSGDVSRAGRWIIPCGLKINDMTVYSDDFQTGVHWHPDGCSLTRYLRKQVTRCLQGKIFIFIGDSTLRGIAVRLAAWYGSSRPDVNSGHNYWATAFGNATRIFYQYFPRLPDTVPVRLWEHRRETSTDPQFVDYFANIISKVKSHFNPWEWRNAKVHITVGGLILQEQWMTDIQQVIASPLWGDSAEPTVLVKSRGQTALRSSLYEIHRKNEIFKQYVANRTKFKWFETESITQPFWPHMVKADRCLCHFHVEHQDQDRISGPVNTEILNVWLNSICSK